MKGTKIIGKHFAGSIVLSMLVMLLLASCDNASKCGQALFDQADIYASEGSYDLALESLAGAAGLGYQSSAAHLRAGIICEERMDNCDLALWHYQRAANMAEKGTSDAVAAGIRLDLLWQKMQEKSRVAANGVSGLSDKDAVIKILEDRCEELSVWTRRLNEENLALRQMLLEMQNELDKGAKAKESTTGEKQKSGWSVFN